MPTTRGAFLACSRTPGRALETRKISRRGKSLERFRGTPPERRAGLRRRGAAVADAPRHGGARAEDVADAHVRPLARGALDDLGDDDRAAAALLQDDAHGQRHLRRARRLSSFRPPDAGPSQSAGTRRSPRARTRAATPRASTASPRRRRRPPRRTGRARSSPRSTCQSRERARARRRRRRPPAAAAAAAAARPAARSPSRAAMPRRAATRRPPARPRRRRSRRRAGGCVVFARWIAGGLGRSRARRTAPGSACCPRIYTRPSAGLCL